MNFNIKGKGDHTTYGCVDNIVYSLGNLPVVETSVAAIINLLFEFLPTERKSTLIRFYHDPYVLAGYHATYVNLTNGDAVSHLN